MAMYCKDCGRKLFHQWEQERGVCNRCRYGDIDMEESYYNDYLEYLGNPIDDEDPYEEDWRDEDPEGFVTGLWIRRIKQRGFISPYSKEGKQWLK